MMNLILDLLISSYKLFSLILAIDGWESPILKINNLLMGFSCMEMDLYRYGMELMDYGWELDEKRN